MRKLILLALAGFVWKKIQAKAATPRIITDLSSVPRP
jgi:hypothetical protein